MKMTKKYEGIIASMPQVHGWRWAFITFTIRTEGQYRESFDQLSGSLKDLWEKFLRRDNRGQNIKGNRKGVKVATGMVSCVEFGPLTGNVHVHCLYYGPYIPVGDTYLRPNGKRVEAWRRGGMSASSLEKEGATLIKKGLRSEWKARTGAFIVDIRSIRGGIKSGLRETIKYASKGGSMSLKDVKKQVDFERAMAGKRRIRSFGVLYDPEIEARLDDGTPWLECECGSREYITEDSVFRSSADDFDKRGLT